MTSLKQLERLAPEVDVDQAWSITQRELGGRARRRRRAQRLAGAGVAGVTALALTLGIVISLDSDRADVTVRTPRSTESPGSSLTELRWSLGTMVVERGLRLSADEPVSVAPGERVLLAVRLENITSGPIPMGFGLAQLSTVLSDASGRIVGGGIAAGSFLEAQGYDAIGAGETFHHRADLAAVALAEGFPSPPAPLAPGDYLLWIELPSEDVNAPSRVAGPLAITVG